MKRGYSSLVAALLLGALSACETTSVAELGLDPASLPADVRIVEPAADVPAEFAAFAGVWDGRWGYELDSALAVQRVTAEGDVTAIYSWGDSAGNFDAGRVRRDGYIRDGTLHLNRFGNGARARFELQDDGTLRGTYIRGARVSKGTFRKRSEI
jgi:hypothetical protein